jgi:urease accessory protein
MLKLHDRYEGDDQSVAILSLPFDLRQRSRLRVTLSTGQEASVSLPRGGVLRGGDKLIAQTGDIVEVEAALESVSVVRSNDPLLLTRAAYHLGNRHVAVEICDGKLVYLHDHVLDAMLQDFGLIVSVEMEPFEPESGAYSSHGGHNHSTDETHSHHSHAH